MLPNSVFCSLPFHELQNSKIQELLAMFLCVHFPSVTLLLHNRGFGNSYGTKRCLHLSIRLLLLLPPPPNLASMLRCVSAVKDSLLCIAGHSPLVHTLRHTPPPPAHCKLLNMGRYLFFVGCKNGEGGSVPAPRKNKYMNSLLKMH
jgi:hypothetical protein